jgi:hypothetical protein
MVQGTDLFGEPDIILVTESNKIAFCLPYCKIKIAHGTQVRFLQKDPEPGIIPVRCQYCPGAVCRRIIRYNDLKVGPVLPEQRIHLRL